MRTESRSRRLDATFLPSEVTKSFLRTHSARPRVDVKSATIGSKRTVDIEVGCSFLASARLGFDVSLWHFSDITFVLRDVRSQGQSGKHLLALSFSAFDRPRADIYPCGIALQYRLIRGNDFPVVRPSLGQQSSRAPTSGRPWPFANFPAEPE